MPLSAEALQKWMDWAAVAPWPRQLRLQKVGQPGATAEPQDFYATSKQKDVITAESCQGDIPVTQNHDVQPDSGAAGLSFWYI